MKSLKGTFAALAVLALTCSVSRAQTLVVETWAGTTPGSSNSYYSPPSSPASIPIPLTTSTTRINLYSASSSNLASIGPMTFSNTTPSNMVDLVIGSGALINDWSHDLSDAGWWQRS